MKEKFCTITPTRDRPKMLQFCRAQLELMTIHPQSKYFINYNPTDSQPDLIRRVRSGIELAQRDGIDIVYIIEDDDCMPADYFELMDIGDNDFIGSDSTYYYNIKNKTWRYQQHPGRSSLFCTGFRISALENFRWPADHNLFLDIALWDFARDTRKKVKLMSDNPCTGIKGHGEGMHGGKAHKQVLENKDNEDMDWLANRTDDFQFKFLSKWKTEQ